MSSTSAWVVTCGEAPVRLEAQILPRHVVLRQVRVEREIELDLGRLAERLALQLGDHLVDHLAVQVVADGGDVARLAGAEQVAGAPDLEVAHGDLEAAAELGGLTDRLQPFVCLLGQRRLRRIEEIGVGAHAGAADATTELVELPEPEPVGAVDDERVHRRHVDAGLDDRGADEHVVLVLPEVDDDPARACLRPSVRARRRHALRERAHGCASAVCSMSCTRLCTKNTCPSRSSSRRIASPTARSSYSPT